MEFQYDLFVIGGGSGGVRAARVAAGEAGAKVALAEEDRYGGTCVIRGCVPKKLMVYASEFPDIFQMASGFGWDVKDPEFNWEFFRDKMHGELDRLEGIYRTLLKNSNVDTYDARATVVDPHTVELSTGQRVTAKTILLAMGGRPSLPNVPGIEHAITSNEMFHLDPLPKSILIVGGGYIASEFAGIMNGMGVKTTQMYRGDQILRGFDLEARTIIADQMRANGVNLLVNTDVAEIELLENGQRFVRSKDGQEMTFDAVMYATGRVANTANMGLAEVGVDLADNGDVVVDAFSQTTVPSIYAVGDITGRAALTPVAIREGMAFVETVFKDNPTAPDHDLIPTAIFTQPEFGTIGLSEEDAAKQEPVDIFSTSFKSVRPGFGDLDHPIFMKLIVSKATRTVLGCHIIGYGAGEMIQLAGIAVKMGATKEDFDRTVAVHPTAAEELVTMRHPVRSA